MSQPHEGIVDQDSVHEDPDWGDTGRIVPVVYRVGPGRVRGTTKEEVEGGVALPGGRVGESVNTTQL